MQNPAISEIYGPIMIFSSEAGVQPHVKASYCVGKMLQSLGHKVLVVRCTGVLTRCSVMDMYNMPFGEPLNPNRQACVTCLQTACQLHAAYGLQAVDLASVNDEYLQPQVADLLRAAPSDLREFEYDGVPFGKLSAIDFALATKADDTVELQPEHRRTWLTFIGAAVQHYVLATRLITAHSASRIFYFSDYGINLAVRWAAKKLNVPAYTLNMPSHRIIDRSKLEVLAEPRIIMQQKALKSFAEYKQLSIPAREVEEIFEDSLLRMSGKHSHVYSPSKTANIGSILNGLRLDPTKKILVAFTSSMDEYRAMVKSIEASGHVCRFEHPFPEAEGSMQIGWLLDLIAFLRTSPDVQLIIRVHPREGVTHREAFASAHLDLLKKHFTNLPDNCRIVWPEEKVSSYDLAEIADTVLTAWSTMGLECARLGVPVLAAHKGLTISGCDFIEYGASPEAYYSILRRLLSESPRVDVLLRALRFHAHYHLRSAIDISDIIAEGDSEKTPLPLLSRHAGRFAEVIAEGKSLTELSYAALEECQSGGFDTREMAALAAGIRTLIHFLMTGEVRTGLGYLRVVRPAATQGVIPDESLAESSILVEGALLRYRIGTQVLTRFSPMACRLAALLEQAESRISAAEVIPSIATGQESRSSPSGV